MANGILPGDKPERAPLTPWLRITGICGMGPLPRGIPEPNYRGSRISAPDTHGGRPRRDGENQRFTVAPVSDS
jgi:hypothetical protein